MRIILILVSLICLGLTIVPPFMVFTGSMSSDQNKTLMLVGTIGWFITAPFWMKQK